MTQPFRRGAGGDIDRGRTLSFTFDGVAYRGHPGDTLASALLANGVRLVARSFKYHRPRGILSAGPEEPSALVQLEHGAWTEPNRRATEIVLYDGLAATSQNAWPRLGCDLAAISGLLAPLFVAGFYYKTFMRPKAAWDGLFERALRRMAGLGRAPALPDPSRYDKTHAHCDVLVVGGGPAGLIAALAAGRSGARVILADADEGFGGDLLRRPQRIDGADAALWLGAMLAALTALPETRLLPATTVFGLYDGNYAMAVERVGERLGPGTSLSAPAMMPRQRLWHIRARRIVLAAGAVERPLVFAGNDRPGVMLAGAAATYAHRYAVLPGRRAVVLTNNDSAYAAAAVLATAGVAIAAIVDLRTESTAAAPAGVPVLRGHGVAVTRGRQALSTVAVAPLATDGASFAGKARWLDCDLLAVSGGWNPAVQLFAHAQGRLRFDPGIAAFVPDAALDGIAAAGAANGRFALADALADGGAAGAAAAAICGFGDGIAPPAPSVDRPAETPLRPLWLLPAKTGAAAFVDLQNDVTAADLALAAREGYGAVEHAKRYTTLGMGTDQGKTGGVAGLAILAAAVGRSLAESGTTTFRPPAVPVAFGALAGRDRGVLADPLRVTPMHDWHAANGAVFENVGQWQRPRFYPRADEDMAAAVRRECLAVRDAVGLFDASTLGKIEIRGPDAARFLDRIYTNRWSSLAVGRCRYGLMCREDGMVFDDGIGARLARDHFVITTTTGNAAAVLDWLEEWLQTEWTDLDVFCTSATEDWANATLAGKRARAVLARLAPGLALDNAAFPFMTLREGAVAGIPARILRIGYSGELGYEINVPAHSGLALWLALLDAGAADGITPYGTEAMHVLRAEKGFIVIGQETDGSVTPLDLGLAGLVADKDFLGRRSLRRPDTARPDRKELVGLLPDDSAVVLPEGAQLVARLRGTSGGTVGAMPPLPMIGHVTSSYYGPRIGRGFALALVAGGRARHGERVWAASADGGFAAARIVPPLFYDREGRRRDG